MARELEAASCVVLGAGGFIGLHLCRALAKAGARVHGYGHASAYPRALPAAMRWSTGEFADAAGVRMAVRGADLVFHLLGGGDPGSSNREPVRALQEAMLSVRLLEICRAERVGRIVFLSSGGAVYGTPRAVPIAEDAATEPISAYGIGKLALERYLALYANLYGLASVVLRPANPFGPYQNPARGQGIVPAMVASALHGRALDVWGDGAVVRDFLYVEDLCRAVLAAACYTGPLRTFNVGSGIGRSLLEVAGAVAEVVGRPVPIVHRPARPADVPVSVLDSTRITEATGWRPRTAWMDGLRATADWIRAGSG